MDNATEEMPSVFDKEDLVTIANMEMPFGKYKGTPLIYLPEPYLLWFAQEGFPAGKLGRLMELTLALKIEGLEGLVKPLIQTDQESESP